MKFINIFFITLLLIFCINNVSANDYDLPYTTSSNTTELYFNSTDSHNLTLNNDNEIYQIHNYYNFGILYTPTGIYFHNQTMNNYYKTSEKWEITNKIFYKSVNYSITTYENNISISTTHEDYNVFHTNPALGNTKFTILDNNLNIVIKFTDGFSYKKIEKSFSYSNNLIINYLTLESNYQTSSNCISYVEYIPNGVKPKSYYIDELNPLLRTPYNLILKHYDNDNSLLNFFLITSYILTGFLFWIKIIYTSFFAIIIIILLGVIPIISYINSNNRMNFIYELSNNYKSFFNMVIRVLVYIIELIISVLQLIPFI